MAFLWPSNDSRHRAYQDPRLLFSIRLWLRRSLGPMRGMSSYSSTQQHHPVQQRLLASGNLASVAHVDHKFTPLDP